ncbi:MAG: tetratricopeptide repeat protein, partial [Candidatus Acidiferrum sp.]
MGKETQFRAIFCLCLFVSSFLCHSAPALAQDRASADPTIPAELTPADPEIQALLAFESCKPNGAAWTEKLEKALEMANSRGLVGDRALLEASLASAVFVQGNTEQAFLLFQKALQDSIDAKRQVLQADILISLSSEAQMKGNTQGAMDLIHQALSLSERSGNLYGKARALGELGKLELQSGKNDEVASLIDQALDIDKLNGYKFEALHLFYKGSYQGFIGKAQEALQTLADARVKAISAKDTLTFIQADNAYSFGLVKKGKVDEALRQMDLVNRADMREFVPDAALRTCLESYLQLPFVRLIWLEGFANVLEAANQKERQISVWEEIFSTSQGLGLTAGEAEAKEKAANLESQLKKTDEALKDYALAADLYRKLGNEVFLDRVEISESVLLVNVGRGNEAVPLVEEIASYARRLNLRELEFRAKITLAGIYQPAGEMAKARTALERATSLVHPGPFDEELDSKTVHLAYVSLSDVYRKLEIPTKELISIDQAFFVSFHLKDDAAQKSEVNYLDQRLKELRIRELVEQRQKEGQLSESLIYSYILYLRDGMPAKPAEDANWQRILSLPLQIMQKPGGAGDLTEILKDLGPLLNFEKLPLLNALARYYMAAGADPGLTEKYALAAENLVSGLQGDWTGLKAECTCQLAVSYARQGRNVLAQTKGAECVNLAAKTQNEQLIVYADAANSMVQAQTGNIAAAKSSLQKLIAKSPDSPDLLVQLAMSFASAKLYDEANSQLRSAVRKLLSAGDKRTAAGAYVRVSIVLNSDSSDAAKKLQLEYLNAALNLFRELKAPADEGSILVGLGDYFLRVSENKSAVDEYAKAKELAQNAGQKNILAQSLLGLGNAYQAQKDFAKASESHAAAVTLFHELSNSVGETNALRNLGRDYYLLNDPGKALPSLLEARKVANSAGLIYAYFAAYFLGDYYDS